MDGPDGQGGQQNHHARGGNQAGDVGRGVQAAVDEHDGKCSPKPDDG